jgi:hypothetical protein
MARPINIDSTNPHKGEFSSTAQLPNVSGATVQTNFLNRGDLASVDGELYVCQSPGPNAAVWREVLHAASTLDLVLTGDIIADSLNLTAGATVGTTLAVTGNLAINTNKFTVAASSGDTVVAGTLGVTGASTLTGAVGVTGALTATGGMVASQPGRVFNLPLGGTAIASIGTDAVAVAGTVYVSQIFLPANKTLTGIGVLNGTSVGTNDLIVALYNSAGTVLRTSDLAGTLGAGADQFQEVAFTSTYAATGPAMYFVGLQVEGTTHANQRMSANTPLCWTAAVAGSFGTIPAITPPTTFTAGQGPIVYLY